MPVDESTRRQLYDHLGEAEFSLRVAANFACLKDTPAHESVCAAMAQVREARVWIRQLESERPNIQSAELAHHSLRERHQIVQR